MIDSNFALTTLSENPEYFEEVIHLIEEEFHYSEENHFEIDFAPLMDPLNFENCYIVIDKNSNTVAAHLAVCERVLIKNSAQLKVAFIGGIATHKKFRHKNLFRNLMLQALDKHSQVGLFLLWSDLENLYEKFNFFRTGGIVETGKRNLSNSERPNGYEKDKFHTLTDEDFSAIISLYTNFNQKYFFTVLREEKDWSIIREMNSTDLYIKRNSDGEIVRYFCVNKGKDLTNIIHEIGAKNLQEYLGLLKDLESYKLWLPEIEHTRFKNSDVYYTAFFKLGSLETLAHFFNQIAKENIKLNSIANNQVEFLLGNKRYQVSEKDFLQYFFGPKSAEELSPLGLSLYVAGADSI